VLSQSSSWLNLLLRIIFAFHAFLLFAVRRRKNSTRRLCMSPICSTFPHCCSLAATRPAPPRVRGAGAQISRGVSEAAAAAPPNALTASTSPLPVSQGGGGGGSGAGASIPAGEFAVCYTGLPPPGTAYLASWSVCTAEQSLACALLDLSDHRVSGSETTASPCWDAPGGCSALLCSTQLACANTAHRSP
jgi:hypothetical protein